MPTKKTPIIIGEPFTRLTVIAFHGKNPNGKSIYECRCDCGNTTHVLGTNLRQGLTKSCGCLNADKARNNRAALTHGLSNTAEWKAWRGMKNRCYLPTCKRYDRYGGRGIKVCDEWLHDFMAFYNHVGPRPSSKHSLDRYPNPDGNYEPGNVRWATRSEQRCNRGTI